MLFENCALSDLDSNQMKACDLMLMQVEVDLRHVCSHLIQQRLLTLVRT